MNWEENLIIVKNINAFERFEKEHGLSYKFFQVEEGVIKALILTPYGTPVVVKLEKDGNKVAEKLRKRGCIECTFGDKHWIRSV